MDDSVRAWETLYKFIIDKHIPLRLAKVRSNSLPWMTSSLREELNKRDNLLLKAPPQKKPRGCHEWLAYKKQRNYCTKFLRSAEISYWSNKLANDKSSKEFWRLAKSFQSNNKRSSIGPVKSPSGSLLTENLSKANEFNSYFTNTCSTLANINNSSTLNPSTQPVNHIYRVTPTLQSFTVNKERAPIQLFQALRQSGTSLWP